MKMKEKKRKEGGGEEWEHRKSGSQQVTMHYFVQER